MGEETKATAAAEAWVVAETVGSLEAEREFEVGGTTVMAAEELQTALVTTKEGLATTSWIAEVGSVEAQDFESAAGGDSGTEEMTPKA